MPQVATIVEVISLIVLMVMVLRIFIRGASGHSTRPSKRVLGVVIVAGVVAIAAAIVALSA